MRLVDNDNTRVSVVEGVKGLDDTGALGLLDKVSTSPAYSNKQQEFVFEQNIMF